MAHPKAYEPIQGQRYHILVKCPGDRVFEHSDYAATRAEMKYLLNEYRVAYGGGYEFKVIELPRKYWPKNHLELERAAKLEYGKSSR